MFSRIANLFGRKPAPNPAEPAAAAPASNAAPASGTEQPSAAAPAPGPAAPCAEELPANEMLARLIAGRTIRTVTQDGSLASVTFTDGSVMKIKTGAPAPVDAMVSKTVQHVRQDGVCFELVFKDNASAMVTLAEQASSVLLRDGQGTFEYAD